MNRRENILNWVLVFISLIFMYFAINIFGNSVLKKYNIDFTNDNIFKLSGGTEHIIDNLHDRLTLRYFYSKSAANGYPIVKSHAERILGVLQNYAKESNGKIELKVIDPKAFTEEEDLATGYGIKGISLGNNSDDKLYLGLAITNSRDDVRIVPFFHPDRQRFVEYEITKAIYDLSKKKRSVVGILSSIEMESKPMFGIPGLGGGQGWLFLEQIKQGADIVNVEKTTNKIPESVDVLLLVQPLGFNQETLYAVDQFVLKGGKLVVFADPNQEGVAASGNNDDRSFMPEFNKLLNNWGVKIASDMVVLDRNAARPVKDNPDEKNKVEYIAWLNIGTGGLNNEDITTSMLKNLNFASAGAIESAGVAGFDFIPLAKTSVNSMRVNASMVRGTPDPNKLLSNFVSDNKEYVLAARVSGKFKTAFPEIADGNLMQSSTESNIIFIADSDILRDDSWANIQDIQGYKVVMQSADNGSFISNIVDLFSGSDELIALRGRGAPSYPFTVVEDIKRKAEEKFLAKEKELKDKLADTEARLADLKKQAEAGAGDNLFYQSAQRSAIAAFSEDMIQTKKQLRTVQYELKKDVDKLGSILKFINILLMPIMVTVFAVFLFAFYRVSGRLRS